MTDPVPVEIPIEVRQNERNWDEWLRKDPKLARLERGIAHCGRIMVIDRAGSPQYAQALKEYRDLCDRRRDLLEARAQGPK